VSDFRVIVPPSRSDHSYYIRELDWDDRKKEWTVSERHGEGKDFPWIYGVPLTDRDYIALFDFFHLDRANVESEEVIHRGPGDLTDLHQRTNDIPSVFAALREKCGQHWSVFRWESDRSIWLTYGRDCGYAWKIGWPLSIEAQACLGQLRGLTENFTAPPQFHQRLE